MLNFCLSGLAEIITAVPCDSCVVLKYDHAIGLLTQIFLANPDCKIESASIVDPCWNSYDGEYVITYHDSLIDIEPLMQDGCYNEWGYYEGCAAFIEESCCCKVIAKCACPQERQLIFGVRQGGDLFAED